MGPQEPKVLPRPQVPHRWSRRHGTVLRAPDAGPGPSCLRTCHRSWEHKHRGCSQTGESQVVALTQNRSSDRGSARATGTEAKIGPEQMA